MALVFLPIIIPKFMRARSLAHTSNCINHLAQIDGAKQMWAKENNKNPNVKQPGENPDGKYHFNPGNMAGKKPGDAKQTDKNRDEARKPNERPTE